MVCAAGRAHLAATANQTGPVVTMETGLRQRKAIGDRTKGEPRARLGELSIPTLVANGTHDVMVPPIGPS
jgi:pimeloyl-ACP methyl ester carboxylesterase